jgi:hypothetical protein
MRCSVCGKEIPKNQEVVDTKSDQVFNGRSWSGVGTETVRIYLCPTCARRRSKREVWVWIALATFFLAGAAMIIMRLLQWLPKGA